MPRILRRQPDVFSIVRPLGESRRPGRPRGPTETIIGAGRLALTNAWAKLQNIPGFAGHLQLCDEPLTLMYAEEIAAATSDPGRKREPRNVRSLKGAIESAIVDWNKQREMQFKMVRLPGPLEISPQTLQGVIVEPVTEDMSHMLLKFATTPDTDPLTQQDPTSERLYYAQVISEKTGYLPGREYQAGVPIARLSTELANDWLPAEFTLEDWTYKGWLCAMVMDGIRHIESIRGIRPLVAEPTIIKER